MIPRAVPIPFLRPATPIPSPKDSTPRPPNAHKRPVTVLYVPGTSNHEVPEEFKKALKKRFKNNYRLICLQYPATWALKDSVAAGDKVLKETLDALIKNNEDIYLFAESQGALISSHFLSQPKYYNRIHRAVLVGHPGVSAAHWTSDRKILEFNHPLDPTSFRWTNLKEEEALEDVQKLRDGDLTTLPTFVRVALTDPIKSAWLGFLSLSNLPLIGSIIPHPHNYSQLYPMLISWLMCDVEED